MHDLLDEMRQCGSVQACIDLALTDAYGPDEQAAAWLACIETMFGRFKQVVGVNYPGRSASIILAGVARSELNYLFAVANSEFSCERLVRAVFRR